MKYKFFLYCLLFSIFTLFFTGCWNSRELSELEIVSIVGLEKADGNVKLTSQVIVPKNMKSQGSSVASESRGYQNYSVEGITVFDAIRNTTLISKSKLFHQHNKAIVLTENIAKEGLLNYIDIFLRDHEIRPEINILITKASISETLNAKTKLSDVPGFYISDLLENTKSNSKVCTINIKKLFSKFTNEGIEGYAPIATLSEDKKTLKLCGTGIFKKDKLVGNLNCIESRGLLWVLGEVKSGVIVVDCPDMEGQISLEIIRASSKIIVEKNGDDISITVKIKEMGNIGGQSCPINDLSPDIKDTLVKEKNEAIKKEIVLAIKKAQEYKSDVFGFGQAIYKKYPKYWHEISSQWEEIFSKLDVNIIVESKIKRSGSLTKWNY